RRQRAGREGVRLARHRLFRGRGVDRVRFCAAAGLRAHHGGDVCRAQPVDRRALRPDRSAREDRGMSNASCGELSTAAQPTRSAPSPQTRSAPSPQGGGEPTESGAPPRAASIGIRTAPAFAHNTGVSAALRHARYILGENAVTGFACALFLVIVLAALLGPYLVLYDPLASDTAAALKAPSAAHWFGTGQLGRDVLSRVVVRARPRFFLPLAFRP